MGVSYWFIGGSFCGPLEGSSKSHFFAEPRVCYQELLCLSGSNQCQYDGVALRKNVQCRLENGDPVYQARLSFEIVIATPIVPFHLYALSLRSTQARRPNTVQDGRALKNVPTSQKPAKDSPDTPLVALIIKVKFCWEFGSFIGAPKIRRRGAILITVIGNHPFGFVV
ncbi:hypothetical protein SK128_027415 [Halocaridina rubra]|uniref:Uncharacterized protein n=1 Tax=Halocaridina rubra TaxID=373956 RepID=A0AAN8X1L9_HALRR